MAEETGGAMDPTLVTTVTDDAESNYMAHAEQAAREAAAQRRQKILQKAQERLSIVEGTYSSSKKSVEDTLPDGTEAPEAPTTASTASRLAAMRRRRFKKSAAAVEPTEDTAAASTSDPEAALAEEPAAVVAPVVIPEEEAVSAEMPSLTKESLVEPETIESVESEVVPPLEENAPPKKKYLGVAKMRRRRIQEERQPEATSTTPVEEVLPKPKKPRSLVTTLPIAMYLVTTLLLFLTGLNIGLQQSTVDYCYDGAVGADVCTVVPSELAPRSLGGLQRILSLMDPTTNTAVKKVIKPSVATPEWQEALQTEEEVDEFAENGASTPSSDHNNIDPVFGVDLDRLTQGGNGIYFALARFAVRVHRWNLAVVYYGPRSFCNGLSSFVWSLIQFPPILFLWAMAIRQGMGKMVLGAKLPEKVVDATQHKDIVSTIQTFVSNGLSSSFPTAVTLYDIYTHLRSDMYVLLCGLLVGWAWSHRHQAGSPYGGVPLPLEDERRDEL